MGARAWLIAGEKAKPRYRYFLSAWFVVDKTGRERGKNVVFGSQGKRLEGKHRLDQEAWFATSDGLAHAFLAVPPKPAKVADAK